MEIRQERKEYLQYCREMDLDPEISLYWVIYLAGRRAGAEDMRERAAKKCEIAEIQTVAKKGQETAARLKVNIRALKVEE